MELVEATLRHDFAAWLRRVHGGCKLVFWFLILPVLAVIVVAFCFPIVGLDSSHLKWARLLHTAGGFPLLWGVLLLTAPCPHAQERGKLAALAAVVRVMAFATIAERLALSALDFTVGVPASVAVSVAQDAFFVASLVIGAAYVRRLAFVLGAGEQVRMLWAFGCGLVLLTSLDWLQPFRPETQNYRDELV